MEKGYQQHLGSYNYSYRGDLWKMYLIMGISYILNAIVSLIVSRSGGGNIFTGLFYVIMSFVFKDLSFNDLTDKLFVKWGPLNLFKYLTCGCYNCQELHVEYDEIESYHIEDWSCWNHWCGITRCPFDYCTSVTYSNNKFCCCRRDEPYKVFKLRMKYGFRTWFPFKECDPICCCCCRVKYIGLVTNDVNAFNNLLMSKNIPMNNSGGPVTLIVGNNQPQIVSKNVTIEGETTKETIVNV